MFEGYFRWSGKRLGCLGRLAPDHVKSWATLDFILKVV